LQSPRTWAEGNRQDLEDEHDGGEPDVDDEPSLGWTDAEAATGDEVKLGTRTPPAVSDTCMVNLMVAVRRSRFIVAPVP